MTAPGAKSVAFVLPPIVEILWTFSYNEMYLGIGYLAALTREAGHEVHVVDCQVDHTTIDALQRRLRALRPDVVAIPTVYGTMYNVYLAAQVAREVGVPRVIAGGLPATFVPERILSECPEIDVCVVGEGEHTFVELLSGVAHEQVAGIVFRGPDGAPTRTAARTDMVDVERLPLPARELFPLRRYQVNSIAHGARQISTILETRRGCPYACEFCVQSFKEGRRVRCRSVDHVLRELEDIRRRFPFIDRVMIVDNDFFVPRAFGVALLEAIIREGFNRDFEFMCASRLSHFQDGSDELLDLCDRANLRLVYFGVESANDKNRERIGKVRPGDRLSDLFERMRHRGVHSVGSYIFGFENETRQDILETIQQSIEDAPSLVKYNIVVPYPGTPLHESYREQGYLLEDKPLWLYDNVHQVTRHPVDLEQMFFEAYRRFFVRRGYLAKLRLHAAWSHHDRHYVLTLGQHLVRRELKGLIRNGLRAGSQWMGRRDFLR
jgi:anaerobic magnesium-protoporphyrin IX monomethyl ester cyclase